MDNQLDFQSLTLAHRLTVDKYMRQFGEGSCQHSFASMFCFNVKYGYSVCEKDEWLFVRRDKLCDSQYNTYLMPMGEGDASGAVRLLKEDARANSKLLKFETVTHSAKDLLAENFPDKFEIEKRRDYAEYIYTFEKLAELPGPKMASKRYDVSTFWRRYKERAEIRVIEQDNLEEVRSFQTVWFEKNKCDKNEAQLEIENEGIMLSLDHYEELGLSGILLYVDNLLCGYAYGSKLSSSYYNVMIEKGNREIEDIYRILNMEIVKKCCQGIKYINREEDLGILGLRKAKLSYKPDILMNKYVVKEVVE